VKKSPVCRRKGGATSNSPLKSPQLSAVGATLSPSSATSNRKIARAEELGSDLQKIAGTSLDKGVEMDALISSSDGGAGIT